MLTRSALEGQILEVLERHRGEAGTSTAVAEGSGRARGMAAEPAARAPVPRRATDEERHRNQDAFLNEDVDIVVATVAFGMGIDRSDVRFVTTPARRSRSSIISRNPGRAGRDGLEAECVLLPSGADF